MDSNPQWFENPPIVTENEPPRTDCISKTVLPIGNNAQKCRMPSLIFRRICDERKSVFM